MGIVDNLMNKYHMMDGIEMLYEHLSNRQKPSLRATFFDPQYRGVLSKLNYGNEGSRQKARSLLKDMDDDTIKKFIELIFQATVPSGYLFLWVDKFHLCQGVKDWTTSSGFNIVDLLTWQKTKFGMGYRTRRQCEYLLILQKKPILAQKTWTVRNISDCIKEGVPSFAKYRHAHTKPFGIVQKLIEATTEPEDLVGDFAAGSYSTMFVANRIGRNFIGCDISTTYEDFVFNKNAFDELFTQNHE